MKIVVTRRREWTAGENPTMKTAAINPRTDRIEMYYTIFFRIIIIQTFTERLFDVTFGLMDVGKDICENYWKSKIWYQDRNFNE